MLNRFLNANDLSGGFPRRGGTNPGGGGGALTNVAKFCPKTAWKWRTRIHSSRMHTIRCSGRLSCYAHPRCHAHPLPCMPPVSCMHPFAMHAPFTMHVPLLCMPLSPHMPPFAMHAPLWHACSPSPHIPPFATHAPFMPPSAQTPPFVTHAPFATHVPPRQNSRHINMIHARYVERTQYIIWELSRTQSHHD